MAATAVKRAARPSHTNQLMTRYSFPPVIQEVPLRLATRTGQRLHACDVELQMDTSRTGGMFPGARDRRLHRVDRASLSRHVWRGDESSDDLDAMPHMRAHVGPTDAVGGFPLGVHQGVHI